MTAQNAELIIQLNTLLTLTGQEANVARIRIAQARTEATRKELRENAANCEKRADAIRQAVIDLGGAPDVVGAAFSRAAAAARLPVEQGMPITEALLSDLALEHQLFDRARLVKVLAHDADAADLVALAERLEDAHGNTIQWLFTVLSETAIGGPAALVPTPAQSAAATARTAATFATSTAATGLNKAIATAGHLGERVQETAAARAGRLGDLAASARKIVRVGRDATLAETEKQADKELGGKAGKTVHSVREGLGVVDAADLPIKRFDTLTSRDAVTAVGKLSAPDDVQVVLAYEHAHKARQTVVDAADKRITELAKELVNS